jgi:hypothetical protein
MGNSRGAIIFLQGLLWVLLNKWVAKQFFVRAEKQALDY